MLHCPSPLQLLCGQSLQTLQDRGFVCQPKNQQHSQFLPQREEDTRTVCKSWELLEFSFIC